jgi:hypothetical protein
MFKKFDKACNFLALKKHLDPALKQFVIDGKVTNGHKKRFSF